jgi:hypothetical protein
VSGLTTIIGDEQKFGVGTCGFLDQVAQVLRRQLVGVVHDDEAAER